jgi:hypothetical protein
VTYGGVSGNRIFVLYWRCSLIRVSVIRGSTVLVSRLKTRASGRLLKIINEMSSLGAIVLLLFTSFFSLIQLPQQLSHMHSQSMIFPVGEAQRVTRIHSELTKRISI